MLPYHHKLIHLYQPPTEDLNPSRESGEDVEQAVAMPRVTAFRFRNTGASDPDNNCANCPITLGIGVGGTARNGMELRFTIDGHRAGMEYDITRTRRDSFWQRDAGVWSELGSNPMGTNDDHHDNDEWLIPRRGFIYAIDRPGYATLTLGTPATPLGGGTLWPGAVTSATAQDVVLRYSFAEWVIARHRGEGIPWTPLELPPMRDGTPRRFVFWRCVVWITRDGAGNFVLDVPRCRIERGSFSAAVLNAAPT
jgi:hypothetical protein